MLWPETRRFLSDVERWNTARLFRSNAVLSANDMRAILQTGVGDFLGKLTDWDGFFGSFVAGDGPTSPCLAKVVLDAPFYFPSESLVEVVARAGTSTYIFRLEKSAAAMETYLQQRAEWDLDRIGATCERDAGDA